MKKLKKGDKVQIMLGKDRGKSGQVERVLSKEQQVLVTGMNMYKRHVKGQGQIEGGVIQISKPLNVSNVTLICPNCNKPTRVGFQVTKQSLRSSDLKDIKSRVCKKCGKTF